MSRALWRHRFSLGYRWGALSRASLGTLLAAIDGGSLIVALPVDKMFRIFSGSVSRALSAADAAPFIGGFHAALLAMAGASLVGAAFSALRGEGQEAST